MDHLDPTTSTDRRDRLDGAGEATRRVTLVLGGARSGKSAVAEQLIERHSGPLVYLATGSATDVAGAPDLDMAGRIDAHRTRRGTRYSTVEAGPDLAAAIDGLGRAPALPVLIDSLGTWVAAHHDLASDGFPCDTAGLTSALLAYPGPIVVVSDEVGLGVHPSTRTGRRFRDALGTVNQAAAAIADDVFLAIAGRVLPLPAVTEVT